MKNKTPKTIADLDINWTFDSKLENLTECSNTSLVKTNLFHSMNPSLAKVKMKQDCNCEVIVSCAAEQGIHSPGSRHFNGNAVDIRMSNPITTYVNGHKDIFWWTNNEGDHWHLEFK